MLSSRGHQSDVLLTQLILRTCHRKVYLLQLGTSDGISLQHLGTPHTAIQCNTLRGNRIPQYILCVRQPPPNSHTLFSPFLSSKQKIFCVTHPELYLLLKKICGIDGWIDGSMIFILRHGRGRGERRETDDDGGLRHALRCKRVKSGLRIVED